MNAQERTYKKWEVKWLIAEGIVEYVKTIDFLNAKKTSSLSTIIEKVLKEYDNGNN